MTIPAKISAAERRNEDSGPITPEIANCAPEPLSGLDLHYLLAAAGKLDDRTCPHCNRLCGQLVCNERGLVLKDRFGTLSPSTRYRCSNAGFVRHD